MGIDDLYFLPIEIKNKEIQLQRKSLVNMFCKNCNRETTFGSDSFSVCCHTCGNTTFFNTKEDRISFSLEQISNDVDVSLKAITKEFYKENK